MNKQQIKIKNMIRRKEKELKDFLIRAEQREKEQDEKFSKQLDEDFNFKNSLNPFYKPKAFKIASDEGIATILANATIRFKIENEIRLLKEII